MEEGRVEEGEYGRVEGWKDGRGEEAGRGEGWKMGRTDDTQAHSS